MTARSGADKDLAGKKRVARLKEGQRPGGAVQEVVADRGPFHRHRDIDLSHGLAKRLSLARKGFGTLKMRVLSNR